MFPTCLVASRLETIYGWSFVTINVGTDSLAGTVLDYNQCSDCSNFFNGADTLIKVQTGVVVVLATPVVAIEAAPAVSNAVGVAAANANSIEQATEGFVAGVVPGTNARVRGVPGVVGWAVGKVVHWLLK